MRRCDDLRKSVVENGALSKALHRRMLEWRDFGLLVITVTVVDSGVGSSNTGALLDKSMGLSIQVEQPMLALCATRYCAENEGAPRTARRASKKAAAFQLCPAIPMGWSEWP